ncbi:MAG: DUF262 domain-containing protein [Lachnospiraceae bacterium]|nr:DUF262 domain-containing protein [Lachnospiraceae bacterium]
MEFKQSIVEKIQELKLYAEKSDNIVWYDRVLDILYEKDDTVTEEVIENVIKELEDYGIHIERKTDEGYEDAAEGTESFIPADVNISQRPMNVYNIMERLENHEINMEPEFQRHGNLWTKEQQSRLIESLMLKIPIPTFYFNAADEEEWVVIDGLQRLSAFYNFLVGKENENGVRVKEKFCGLQYMRDFNDKTFDDLPRQYIRRIKETPIVAYTVEKGTPDGIVYNIFQRINTGGVILTSQEIRHALYGGKATELLQKLAESDEFLQVTLRAIPSKRMLDREYVNRFIAFVELDYEKDYGGNIDDFLRKALKKVNGYKKDKIAHIEETFYRVMEGSWDIFGIYAFRKYNNQSLRRGPINKALFETWSLVLSELSQDEIDTLVKKKEELMIRFGDKLQDDEFNLALKGEINMP